MADDIDDLLDEVETKFCFKSKPDRSTQNNQENKITIIHKKRSNSKLDDDVDDILGLDIPDKQKESTQNHTGINQTNTTTSVSTAKKCFPIYIGGTSNDFGYGSSINKRICDRLRCTSCDFKVCIFSDYEWISRTDYLFLRNNAPDFHKLKSNLKRKKGMNAYNCQCSWKNGTELTELQDSNLKWVCGKH